MTYFYSVMQKNCSCRQVNGDPTKLGVFYREYLNELETKSSSSTLHTFFNEKDPLKYPVYENNGDKGIYRSCCRSRFLSIPIVPMIDTTKNRIFNNTDKTGKHTEALKPGYRLGFPLTEVVIPPKVDIAGSIANF